MMENNPHVPLVSCIMPTANRRVFVPQAISYFLQQDYPNKELVILDDGEDCVADLVPDNPSIRYIRLPEKANVGAKRNLACAEARGEVIVHWDDDDWMSPRRIGYQVHSLLERQADICGLNQIKFYDAAANQAWEYSYREAGRPWVYGATLCYKKSFWRENPFPAIAIGEDSRFVWRCSSAKIAALDDRDWIVCRVHAGNTSPKRPSGAAWRPFKTEEVLKLMQDDWTHAESPGLAVAVQAPSQQSSSALVTAAYGIGDILRVTPLVRVLRLQGYQVDVLVAPDYPETAELLRGLPEIRKLYHYPNFRNNRGVQPLAELAGERYDVAVFTAWSAPLAGWIKAERRHVFSQSEWLPLGDSACVEKIAATLGWRGELPEPLAMASARRFDLPPGTIALHPGCKPDWPWKKWHGFEELARKLPHVVIIGSESDLDNSRTYFRNAFNWPEHAENYAGKLSLADTAALLKHCAALVSNDSGLMHLGVALGVPTFGIFGITSPQRELIPSRRMFPVSKGLPCEPACRQKPWGRRDCEQHLACLKTLSADEVMARIEAQLPALQQRDAPMEPIRLNYYGYVFDATGYGHAARGYIHALHAAGVKVSVINIGAQPEQVRDDLVAGLLGQDSGADFNLFHGIPPQWARLAYPLRNVIAMTVWETDAMPQRWRNPLLHALDVWLPCQFNVDVFNRDLGRTTFCLPHPALPGVAAEASETTDAWESRGVRDGDYVFYGIFEWQDRKNPDGVIKAFLQAFPDEGPPVLLLKTNPGALSAAQHTLAAARAATGSRGRVVLCCEAWADSQLHALHQRGDCYVSLHKGEGWGYPLFDAACLGKPVVATAYSGPLDFLDAGHHALVPYQEAPVQQAYAYYHPGMHWAEPDVNHASEALRRVYAQRGEARARAQAHAATLISTYSLDAIGNTAKNRLLALLKRANAGKWETYNRQQRAALAAPALPIPGAWYDADYFENGVKSNWEQGYTWPLFKGLFGETSAYLIKMFPEAESFLDAGCAKGFLVRALREQGKEAFGFDHSDWALDHAEPATRAYLRPAGVDEVDYQQQFDVLTAMSLLESLTEDQVRAFLARARGWVRQALFATIPTLSPGLDHEANSRDLSHVTLRDRAWWRERFLEAGWRQDPLHRVVERICASHPLPQKMGWSVYVFAPGE